MKPDHDLAVPARVLAIGAHPDDVEFGCGATLAKWAAAGADVHLAVLTDGAKGSWDPTDDPATLVATRRDEQRAAAAVLGATTVYFLDSVDGELVNGPAERKLVCELVRQVKPDVVLSHDPWKRYRLHPDHRHAGFLVIDALVAARDYHFFPELTEEPHRPEAVLLFEAEVVDHIEAVTGYVEAKITALLCHRSQWRSTMGITPGDPAADEQRLRFVERIERESTVAAHPIGATFGESFKRLEV
jgi:LmbE family N-acetylglucosaminyl deacetylase